MEKPGMSTEDRKLLSGAARAAGIEEWESRIDSGLSLTKQDGRHRNLPRWNSLEDSGDALRLLATLNLTVRVSPHEIEVFDEWGDCVVSMPVFDWGISAIEAALRRAITKAAYKIGEDFK
jgi:hypothetical protein